MHAVRRLQHAYGYYLDKCLYDEVVDLFSDSGEVRFMGGIFKGKAGVRRSSSASSCSRDSSVAAASNRCRAQIVVAATSVEWTSRAARRRRLRVAA